jgi:hypothetical protein
MMGIRQKMNGLEEDRVYGKNRYVWNHRSASDVKPRLRRKERKASKISLRKACAERGVC